MKDNGFFKLFFRAFIPTFIILSLLGTLLVIGLIGPDTKKEAPVQSSSNTSFEEKPKEDFYTSFVTIISKNSTITHFVITQITSQQVSVFTLPPNVIISDKTAEVLYKTLSVKDFKYLLSEYTEAKIN